MTSSNGRRPGKRPATSQGWQHGPAGDEQVRRWLADIGVPSIVDIHVHFMPDSVLRKVWAFFDDAKRHYGTAWPVRYREPEQRRLAILRELGVRAFAPLVYPHKPGMARWLNSWVAEFAAATPEAVRTATVYPEPEVAEYLADALAGGARCVKAHVQVGGYDPRDPLLEAAWGMIADAGVPVIVHCGHGPGAPGPGTGLDIFGQVLARHPRLTAVLAHAGAPEYTEAVELAGRYPNVYLDTTMVGVPFVRERAPLPSNWPGMLAELGDKIVFGSDFPNIPYDYATQLRAVVEWANADARLAGPFLRRVLHDTPARLLGLGQSDSPT